MAQNRSRLLLAALVIALPFVAGCFRVTQIFSSSGTTSAQIAAPPANTETLIPPGKVLNPMVLSCGTVTDGQIHTPPDYVTFTPPAKGQTYVDPAYGCPVKRLTDCLADFGLGCHPLYSTMSALNSDDTMILINLSNGAFEIVDVDGKVIVPVANMPSVHGWTGSDPHALYMTSASGLQLIKATIDGLPKCAPNCTVTQSVIHDFSGEYQSVTLGGAQEPPPDDNHLALLGTKVGGGIDIFVPTLSPYSKNAVWTPTNPSWHEFWLTPNDEPVVAFLSSATESGLVLWAGGTEHVLQTLDDHTDFGLDLNGNEVMIADRNADSADPCPGGGGATLYQNLTSNLSLSCLFDKHYAQPHVSYRGGPDQPWVVQSFFDLQSGAENCTPASNWASLWGLYEDEIVASRIDANNDLSKVYRLAHARTHPQCENSYWRQPHATISRSGRYVVFGSDMGVVSSVTDFTDAYIIKIH